MKSFVILLLSGLLGSFVEPVYAQENSAIDYSSCINVLPGNIKRYLSPTPLAGARVNRASSIGAPIERIEYSNGPSIVRLFFNTQGEISTLQVGTSSSGPWTGVDYRFWFVTEEGQRICVPAKIQNRKSGGSDVVQDDGEPIFDLAREQALCRGFEAYKLRNPWVGLCHRFKLGKPVSWEGYNSLPVDEINFIFKEKDPEVKDGITTTFGTSATVVAEARKKCFGKDATGIPSRLPVSSSKIEERSLEPLSPQYRWAQYYLEKCGLDYVKGAIADWEAFGPKNKVGPSGRVK